MHARTNNQRRQYSPNEGPAYDRKRELGVIQSHNSTFDDHIYKAVSKANSILGNTKTFHHWTKEGFSVMNRTYVHPYPGVSLGHLKQEHNI